MPRGSLVFEPDAGMLAAARAVALQVELARAHGGDKTLALPSTPVRRIDLAGDRSIILTDSLEIRAERLIITAGAWVKRLLPELPVPLQVTPWISMTAMASASASSGASPTFEDGSKPTIDKLGAELLAAGIDVTLNGKFVSELVLLEAVDQAHHK
ncbi:MAG: hypothetical protein ACP5XB_30985 [Isosphaeraceae bacterium]